MLSIAVCAEPSWLTEDAATHKSTRSHTQTAASVRARAIDFERLLIERRKSQTTNK